MTTETKEAIGEVVASLIWYWALLPAMLGGGVYLWVQLIKWCWVHSWVAS